MKTVFSFVLLVCCSASSFAQITITSTDVASAFAVGRKFIRNSDTLMTTANIGTPGGTENNWNFSSLASHLVDTSTSVAPSGTPYFSWFPGATHTLRSVQTLQGATGPVYQYFVLGTNLLVPGAGGSAPFPPLGSIMLRITDTPPGIFFQLPLALSTGWTTTYVESLIVNIPLLPPSIQVTNHTVVNTVDGYGSMTLPAPLGTSQVLRIRNDDRFSGASGNGRRISYSFIGRDAQFVQVRAADTLQPNNGIINIDPFSTEWQGPTTTSAPSGAGIPVTFDLLQNYPNPFNPTTTIRYQLPSQSDVTLKVFDVLGREVATIVSGIEDPGFKSVLFDASTLASGVYIYRLQAVGSNGEHFTQMKKLMLVK